MVGDKVRPGQILLPLEDFLVVVLVDFLVHCDFMNKRAFFFSALAELHILCAVLIGPVGGIDPVALEDKVVDPLGNKLATSTARHAASSEE